MLELLGVEKAYSGRTILAGADLVVKPGEAVALVGGNGSGKTTTLRCIAGLARPDRGRVQVCGIDVRTHTRTALGHLSYLPQRSAFPGTVTVREVIGVAARLRRQPATAVDREIERCGLVPVADRLVSHLSGGEHQRLGLAVTFVADAPLLIFDEPSVSLDPAATRMLLDRARELRSAGRAVLYTTHVAADIDALATRVALLRKGRIELLDDLELRDQPLRVVRPQTAGERALARLEVRHEEITLGDDRVAAGDAGLWERGARAAAAAGGPR